MSELKQGTWVVVADGTKVLILENLTDAEDPNFDVTDKEVDDNPPDRDQKTNRAGRNQDGGPGQKSAFEEVDFHELQKERFAEDLADRLYKDAHAKKFESLVIVADPSVLGVLRDNFHKEVQDRIIAEIDKNLTNHPVNEIEDIVSKVLAG